MLLYVIIYISFRESCEVTSTILLVNCASDYINYSNVYIFDFKPQLFFGAILVLLDGETKLSFGGNIFTIAFSPFVF